MSLRHGEDCAAKLRASFRSPELTWIRLVFSCACSLNVCQSRVPPAAATDGPGGIDLHMGHPRASTAQAAFSAAVLLNSWCIVSSGTSGCPLSCFFSRPAASGASGSISRRPLPEHKLRAMIRQPLFLIPLPSSPEDASHPVARHAAQRRKKYCGGGCAVLFAPAARVAQVVPICTLCVLIMVGVWGGRWKRQQR